MHFYTSNYSNNVEIEKCKKQKQKQNKTNKRDLKKAKWKLFIDINIGFINLQPKRTVAFVSTQYHASLIHTLKPAPLGTNHDLYQFD